MRNLTIILVTLIVIPCHAATITVNWDGTGNHTTIQAAIDAAVNNDTVIVADGTYTGTGNRDISFLGKNITVKSANGPETCIIDCQADASNKHRGFIFQNSETTASVLDGFTIQNGYSPEDGTYLFGGGIYTKYASPTITNCIIKTNTAAWGGGLTIRYGHPVITNCTITGNLGTGGAGGFYILHEGASLSNCTISNNTGGHGGGVTVANATVDISNSVITKNHATLYGGGLRTTANTTLTNCTISDNSSDDYGGAIWTYASSNTLTIINSIIWANTAPNDPEIGNMAGNLAVIDVSYSDVQGGYSGTGNINIDPNFVDPVGDDYHLSAGSPCIDQGDPAYVPAAQETDIDGQERIIYDHVDMGADEYLGPGPTIAVTPSELVNSAVEGTGVLIAQNIGISNPTEDTTYWEIIESCPWVEVSPTSGESSGEMDIVAVTVDTTGLTEGLYNCDLIISDPNALNSPQTVNVSLQIDPAWKNNIDLPDDPFILQGSSDSNPGWIKFTSILEAGYDPNVLYYQDSNRFPFHYDFATQMLDPFIGMSVIDYFNVALYETGQQASIGAVILPYNSSILEYGVQFIRHDAYTKEQIVQMFNNVKTTINALGHTAYYFPTYEQYAAAQADEAWLLAQGVPIGSTTQWTSGNVCYSPGWAIGELKYFDAANIQTAYLTGQLKSNDILLTDGIPAEIPDVAGIITLAPTTPNSHVVILAQTYGIPMVYFETQSDIDKAQQMLGFNVVLCVEDVGGSCNVDIKDADADFTQQTQDDLIAQKAPGTLNFSPMASYGAYSADVNDLTPSDIQYFGGKAANYGMLTRSIADNTPVATAFSFDLWNEFLDQTLTNGKTLREEINSTVAGYSYPPADLITLSNDLFYIRESLFKNTVATTFSTTLQDAIINTLQDPRYGFDMNSKIRFRSSTNVEDSDQFIGAGLYDSYSGCLADDLDADAIGPCICDATKTSERGVFRAIRKVFASFYNDNAFIERLKYGVEPNDVGMAVLVHHSFPDEIELANGVATLAKSAAGPEKIITLITQEGAVSVANPVDGSIPEEVSVYVDGSGVITPTFISGSNLVILGEKVMTWQADYLELAQLLVNASIEFENQTGKNDYVLDFEYKKLNPGGAAIPAGGLAVKQIREIPQIDPADLVCPTSDMVPPSQLTCSSPCNFSPSGSPYLKQVTYSQDGVSLDTTYVLYCPFACIADAFAYWIETIITGLTSEPIYLYSCQSQCYSSAHHNWCETFYFEPMFEPGISRTVLSELVAMNIKGIEFHDMPYCDGSGGTAGITYHPFDGTPVVPADFEPDGDVDLTDFSKIGLHWQSTNCGTCGGYDLTGDSNVDMDDLAEFAYWWLF